MNHEERQKINPCHCVAMAFLVTFILSCIIFNVGIFEAADVIVDLDLFKSSDAVNASSGHTQTDIERNGLQSENILSAGNQTLETGNENNHFAPPTGELEFDAQNTTNITAGMDANSATKNEAIEQTLSLLVDGNKQTVLSNHTDVILVLGNTGAGKSTMTHFLAGNNSDLFAYEKDPVTILIKDNRNKISNSTITSQTIFPELVIDPETNTAFYDCPGFSDTRNTSIEIANAFFIKKVADHAKRVKILLVVNHNSVKPGGDRKDFVLLMKHASDFLKNIDNFKDSVALLATKVESRHTDKRIMKGMAKFLEDARQQLDQVLTGEDLTRAGQLIDILLTENDEGDHSRLTFFRQPDFVGPLSENEDVQDRKIQMKEVIFDNIKFTDKIPGDFGFSISEQGQNDVAIIRDNLNQQIMRDFQILAKNVTSYYKQVFGEDIQLENPDVSEETAKEIKFFFKNAIDLNRFTALSSNTTCAAFLKNILLNITWPKNNSVSFDTIIQNGEYLDFFQTLMPRTNEPNGTEFLSWTAPILNFIQSESAHSLVTQIGYSAYAVVTDILGQVYDSVISYHEVQNNGIKLMKPAEILENVIVLLNSIKSMENLNEQIYKNSSLSNFIVDLLENMNTLNTTILKRDLQIQLNTLATFVDFMRESEATVYQRVYLSSVGPSNQAARFQKIVAALNSQLNTVQLMALFFQIHLSTEALASTTVKCYTRKLENPSQSDLAQLQEDWNHFETVLADFEIPTEFYPYMFYDMATNLTKVVTDCDPLTLILNDLKEEGDVLKILLQEFPIPSQPEYKIPLNFIIPFQNFTRSLEVTLAPPICTFETQAGQLTAVIKGHFISLKEITASCLPLSKGIKKVLITSLRTVFFDTDLNGLDFNPENSLNIAIIAPNWVISTPNNSSRITLNGADRNNQLAAAKNGYYSADGKGLHGEPGSPGGNAGNFLGIGKNTWGGKLEIQTIGGMGGAGQNGGNGLPGSNAEDVDIRKIYFNSFYYGDGNIEIRIRDHWPYEYSGGNLACRESDWKTRTTERTFYFLGFIPIRRSPEITWYHETAYKCRDYVFQDNRATSGTNGGDGGAPGLGGREGVIEIIFPEDSNYQSCFSSVSKSGPEGLRGTGGIGGPGGKKGNRVDVQIRPSSPNPKTVTWSAPQGHMPNGRNGFSGGNAKGRVYPGRDNYSAVNSKDFTVNLFIVFARSELKLNNTFLNESLYEFGAFLERI